jgi:hypothetical protein
MQHGRGSLVELLKACLAYAETMTHATQTDVQAAKENAKYAAEENR